MEQITAKITLTKAEWSLLHYVFSNALTPSLFTEVHMKIEREIENGLCTAFYEEECVQRVSKKEENKKKRE